MSERFLSLEDVREVHVEPTSKCQCLCPQCARSTNGILNPLLPLQHLPYETFLRFFTSDVCRRLHSVYFCGNYGDPNMYPHLPRALKYLREQGLRSLRVFTNGNARAVQWWADLARLLQEPHDRVIFSIDGLADTNSIYRINSQWDLIMANARAFIEAGGLARWEFLLFEHNKHQVQEAMALAQTMGFKEFKLKKTKRFTQGASFEKNSFQTVLRVDSMGARQGFEIQMAEEQREERVTYAQLVEEYGGLTRYFAKTEIQCKALQVRSLYLDFKGAVWPCCWMGAPRFGNIATDPLNKEFAQHIRWRWGETFNSVEHHELSEILEHEWFREQLKRSWQKPTAENPRLSVCGRTCGQKLEFSSGFRGSPNALTVDLSRSPDGIQISEFISAGGQVP